MAAKLRGVTAFISSCPLHTLANLFAGCKSRNVADMVKGRMLTFRQQHKVFLSVVIDLMIHVMDNLALLKVAPKFALHYQSVFRDIALLINIRVIWGVNHHIAVSVYRAATVPFVRRLSFLLDGMALQKRDGVPPEVAQIAISILRQWGGLAATTFADTGRNFLRLWRVSSGTGSLEVIRQILRWVIPMMRLEGDRLPATAGANWESV